MQFRFFWQDSLDYEVDSDEEWEEQQAVGDADDCEEETKSEVRLSARSSAAFDCNRDRELCNFFCFLNFGKFFLVRMRKMIS
jgi:hypothetical protein